MANELKVLMMGGQRVGKSSALAAVINAFMTPPINAYLQAKDKTQLDKSGAEKQEPIMSKLDDIKKLLIEKRWKTILVDSGKTSKVWHYRLEIGIPDTRKKMSILFTDVNGEFYENGNLNQETIESFVQDYDVFIVAVDTPCLMGAMDPNNKFVNNIINDKFNYVDDIDNVLSSINFKDDIGAKLVLFVPIKCEKWADENKLSDVVENTKKIYARTIDQLEAYNNIGIEFLPIQTVGSIKFSEHLPAKLITWKKKVFMMFGKEITSRCSIIDANTVRLSDGNKLELSKGKMLDDPATVLIPNSTIVRPNSWYTVKSSEYKPYNCEQLALHIIEFMVKKYIDAELRRRESAGVIPEFINDLLSLATLGIFDRIRGWFGNIPITTMKSLMEKFKEDGIIKYHDEGIEVYKNLQFRSV